MSYEESLKSISLDADASIGVYTGVPGLPGSAVPNMGMQYRFLTITGPHQVGLPAAGAKVIGVLQNKPQKPGAASTVAYHGISNVIAGGAIDAGDLITFEADTGKAIVAASAADAVGVAIYAADGTVDGVIIPVLLTLAS